MTYVVNDKCIMCKHTDCVDVCPSGLLLRRRKYARHQIHECIDCGVCEPYRKMAEDAIKSDQDPEGEHWVESIKTWVQKWEVIDGHEKDEEKLSDFEKTPGEQDKLKKYFNDK